MLAGGVKPGAGLDPLTEFRWPVEEVLGKIKATTTTTIMIMPRITPRITPITVFIYVIQCH